MTATEIWKFYTEHLGGRLDGSLDERNLCNALLGEIAVQLAIMNERAEQEVIKREVEIARDGEQQNLHEPAWVTFDEWFNKWDATGNPEIRRLCRITWQVARKLRVEETREI